MDVYVGDRVQIVNGGMDVTNGLRARSGKYYGEGGPLWATVVLIDTQWRTGGAFGLPSVVTKVRCQADNGVVVWQVQPKDIAPNVIRKSKPEEVQKEPEPKPTPTPPPTEQGNNDLTPPTPPKPTPIQTATVSLYRYAPKAGQLNWDSGPKVTPHLTGTLPSTIEISDHQVPLSSLPQVPNISYPTKTTGSWRKLNSQERASIGPDMEIDESAIVGAKFQTVWEHEGKRSELLAENINEHQNAFGFPYTDSKMASKRNIARKYDFQIIPGDPRFKNMMSLEDKLRDFRASVGLPVHGSNDLARAMKYYMYNRFKVPDLNLAHSKSVTYVFFSRPDLNILCGGTANQQCLNHTEAAMVWRRYPEIFKLLTDRVRCGDQNNFNLLLSNQCTSFDIRDEDLSTLEAGKSWNEYSMAYGDAYSGRTAGEFSCNFNETSDYSVINLIKFWITYIDNVARGAWSPSYNLTGSGVSTSNPNASHVYTKTLDYAASAYVFKCGPDGEDILYWSKYYGAFPISTGAGALSWDNDAGIGGTPKLSIRFKYAFKKDMSPVSLLEFNHLANVGDNPIAEASFNPDYAHSSRPFVGTPFIEMFLGNPTLVSNGVNTNQHAKTSLRLKFMPPDAAGCTNDNNLYRSTMVGTSGNSKAYYQ